MPLMRSAGSPMWSAGTRTWTTGPKISPGYPRSARSRRAPEHIRPADGATTSATERSHGPPCHRLQGADRPRRSWASINSPRSVKVRRVAHAQLGHGRLQQFQCGLGDLFLEAQQAQCRAALAGRVESRCGTSRTTCSGKEEESTTGALTPPVSATRNGLPRGRSPAKHPSISRATADEPVKSTPPIPGSSTSIRPMAPSQESTAKPQPESRPWRGGPPPRSAMGGLFRRLGNHPDNRLPERPQSAR